MALLIDGSRRILWMIEMPRKHLRSPWNSYVIRTPSYLCDAQGHILYRLGPDQCSPSNCYRTIPEWLGLRLGIGQPPDAYANCYCSSHPLHLYIHMPYSIKGCLKYIYMQDCDDSLACPPQSAITTSGGGMASVWLCLGLLLETELLVLFSDCLRICA
jgi:hypothetical protein